jgi:hypothetical protein
MEQRFIYTLLAMPEFFMKPYIYPVLFFILSGLLCSLPVSGQNKIASESKKDREKRAETDPWAEFEEEVDSIRRWEFGLNFGAYLPDKYSANYYNGTPGNENNLIYVMSNKYWYQDIKYSLGSNDTVLIDGYPMDMHYQVAFTGGLFVRFNFSRRHGIFLEANYTRLKANDMVTFEVDPQSYLTYEDIRLEPIAGREGRVLFNLGYQFSYPMKSKIYFFFQGGATMCYTQVVKSIVTIEDIEYNLINVYGDQGYVPNSNSQSFRVHQNAYGFGGFVGGGVGLPLNDTFGLEPGFTLQYYPVNLKDYPQFMPSWSIYLRILIGLGQAGE